MTGMGEMPEGRGLTLGGWPGEGVSAGDEGRLRYTQHTVGAAKENRMGHKYFQSKKSNLVHVVSFTKSLRC